MIEPWFRPGKRGRAMVGILDRSEFAEIRADAAGVAAWEAAKTELW